MLPDVISSVLLYQGDYLQFCSFLQFRACIMEMVCGRPMIDESDMSSSQKMEVSTVSSSQVGPILACLQQQGFYI